MRIKILFCFLLLYSFQQLAVDVREASFKSNSSLFMGGVTVTSYDTDTVLLHNPALINYQKKKLSFPKINVDIYNSKENLLDTLQSLASESEEDQLSILSDLVPLDSLIKINSSPIISLMAGNYAAGYFLDGYIFSALKRQTNPTSYVNANIDSSAAFGFSSEVDVFGKSLIGVSFQYLSRMKVYDDQTGNEVVVLNSSDILNFINDDPEKKDISSVVYSGFDMNLGFAKTFTLFSQDDALFGVAAKNILGNLVGEKIIDSETSEEEIKIPLVITTGVSAPLPIFDKIEYIKSPKFAIDYNIASADNDVADSLFLGVEQVLLADMISLKAGINRGYVVGGVTISLSPGNINLLQISLGQYVEKYGEANIYEAYTLNSFSIQAFF